MYALALETLVVDYFCGHPIIARCSYCGHDYDVAPKTCYSCGASRFRLTLSVDRLTDHEKEVIHKLYHGGKPVFHLPGAKQS